MPITDLHKQVAVIALLAASGHGFALAGGNALLAHGVINRATADVDLFTDDEHGVEDSRPQPSRRRLTPPGSAPNPAVRPTTSRTSFPKWARAWPNGSSPRRMASR
jgi:hypothetical protein